MKGRQEEHDDERLPLHAGRTTWKQVREYVGPHITKT